MKLLVSIHDVTPAHAAAIARLWELCEARGSRPALFVVPNWHGAWPLEEHPSFVHWVRDRERHGADVFLHGERHDEQGTRRGLLDELRAVGRTNREAEFLTLRRDVAHAKIARGAERLRRLGLSPIGFVAPAWLARAEHRDAVTDLGLAVSEDVHNVYLHRRATRLPSPVLRWSGRSSWRAHTSALVSRVASVWYASHSLVRIALHPGDLAHPVTAASLETALDRWIEGRIPWSYSAL